jgi:hypothetical protein
MFQYKLFNYQVLLYQGWVPIPYSLLNLSPSVLTSMIESVEVVGELALSAVRGMMG